MPYSVLVEPADRNRQAFARWCLEQDPPLMTATASGTQIPADLFTSVPDELLDGAWIDGHLFRPVQEGKTPEGGGYREEPEAVRETEPVPEPEAPAARARAPRSQLKISRRTPKGTA